MNDEQLLALYLTRDERAIAESARQYGAYCTTIAMNILHDACDSEECVSDTWFAAWRSIPPERPTRLAAYFGRLARNLSINRYRHRHADKRAGDTLALSLDELSECIPDGRPQTQDEGRIAASISDFLRTQKPLDRRAFVCRYFYCDSIAAIAQALGISESRVKSLLFRMRQKLRLHLQRDGITV